MIEQFLFGFLFVSFGLATYSVGLRHGLNAGMKIGVDLGAECMRVALRSVDKLHAAKKGEAA